MKIYLGIDPGKSGGMAWIDEGGEILEITSMPKTEFDIWDSVRGEVIKNIRAYIEKVHAMPKQGVSSTFTFGTGYGGLRMALIAASIPFEEVTPRTWQKELGIAARKKTETQTQFKERLRAKCQQLFPREEDLWSRTLTYQRSVCDSILIAEYGRRKENESRT